MCDCFILYFGTLYQGFNICSIFKKNIKNLNDQVQYTT